MSEGPKKRTTTSSSSGEVGGGQTEPAATESGGEGKDAGGGSGVALKKQIGLGSACGIIVGKYIHMDCVSSSSTVMLLD